MRDPQFSEMLDLLSQFKHGQYANVKVNTNFKYVYCIQLTFFFESQAYKDEIKNDE